jgi:magnesium-transporting ATPase (P-type)
MARPTRDVRRSTLNVARLESGDWIILGSSVLLFIALIVNWWVSGGSFNSVHWSKLYFLGMLILILATIVLTAYPMLEAESGFRPLPFAIPPVFLLIGFIMFLATIYEFGRYQGVQQPTVSPGFGLYLALVCCTLYLVGALIKWGSRERRIQG